MALINYENKISMTVDPTIDEVNKVTDDNMNEIKSVVNENSIKVSPTEPTGEKVWLKSRGKNLISISMLHIGYIAANGGITVGEQGGERYSDVIKVKPNTTYTFKIFETTGTATQWFGIGEYKTASINTIDGTRTNAGTTSNDYITFTTLATTHYISVSGRNLATASKIQLEENSIATSYEPYGETSININDDGTYNKLTDTVSVGTNPNNAGLWVQHSKNKFNAYEVTYISRSKITYTINNSNKITITGTDSTWSRQEITLNNLISGQKYYIKSNLTNSSGHRAGLLINDQGVDVWNVGNETNVLRYLEFTAPSDHITVQFYTNWEGTSRTETVIFDNIILSTEDINYEPYITPSINVNNNGVYEEIIHSNIYSKKELKIGRWVDGKNLYRIVLTGTLPDCTTSGTSGTNFVPLSDYKIDNISQLITTVTASGRFAGTLPVYGGDNPNQGVRVYYDINAKGLQVRNANNTYNDATYTIILEYTKTTN